MATRCNSCRFICRTAALLAAATLMDGAFAAATYDATTIPDALIVTVASGTEALDAAQVTANVTNVYKRGAGTLTAADLSSYAGDITVEAGAWKYATADGVGQLDSAGSVYVKSGGTLIAEPAAAKAIHLGNVKRIYFEGPGAPGQSAALVYPVNRTEQGSATVGQLFGKNLTMTGDASVYARAGLYLFGVQLDMGCHRLTVSGDLRFSTGSTVTRPGHIFAKSGYVYLLENADFGGGSTNVFDGNATSTLALPHLTKPFLWCVTNVPKFYSDAGNPCSTHQNELAGPLFLSAGLSRVFTYMHEGIHVSGPATGAGGFWVDGWIENVNTSVRLWPILRLSNPNNAFTGGVNGKLCEVYLVTNGALPAAGGELALTNALLKFEDTVGAYALPNARFCATGVPATGNLGVMRVKQGHGAWRARVVKEGAGDLLYDSFVTADRLDIAGGRVRLPAHASDIAGLVYGTRYFSTPAAALAAMNASRELLTNTVVTSTELAYHFTANMQTKAVDYGWTTNMLATYSGYVWNHGAQDAVWSFAIDTVDSSQLYVNNKLVVNANNGQKIFFGDATLKPGPNRFELRMYNNNDKWAGPRGGGYVDPPSDLAWKSLFGFAYDPQGRGSHNCADYLSASDPGDGSLFTAALPGDELVIGGRTLEAQVDFTTIGLTPGAVLDFSTNTTYTVQNLEGFGMASNVALTVAQSWTIDAAAVGQATLAVAETLTFADGAQLRVTGGNDCRPFSERRRFTICTAPGGITGRPALADAKRWRLAKSEDGQSLFLDYLPAGTFLIVR